MVRRRQQRQRSEAAAEDRPPVPLLEEDVNYWVRQFGGLDTPAEEQLPSSEEIPFPPGYGEDVEE